MLFNNSKEITDILGDYYANSNFAKLSPFIVQATIGLGRIVGNEVIALAQSSYDNATADKSDAELLSRVQYAVAVKATMELYRHNDISHEDGGRHVKIDKDHEKIPWEWQLTRDDEIRLDDYYQGIDNLLEYLERKKIAEWLVQKTRMGLKDLLLPNAETFSQYWMIDSPRIFISLVPLISEAQRRWIAPALGEDKFEAMLTSVQGSTHPVGYAEAANALVLYTMFLSFARGLYSFIPRGVIQRNLSTDGMYKGESISFGQITNYTRYLEREAKKVLDDMKIAVKGTPTYKLFPDNDENNPYFII